MRKVLAILLISIFSLGATVRADEGMWLLSLIGKNYEQMKAQGFRLTPEDIYNINRSSLKDAVVGLGNAGSSFWHFCSGELISGEGLFSTNHHCGFGMIQSHSSVEHDYLRDGFWAYKKSDELPNEGITAQILVRMEDVTNKIVPHLNDDMTESERQNVIDSIGKIISDEASKGTVNDAQVIDIFNGTSSCCLCTPPTVMCVWSVLLRNRWVNSVAIRTTGNGLDTRQTSRCLEYIPTKTVIPPTTRQTIYR